MNGNKYIAVAAMLGALFFQSKANAAELEFDLAIRGITVGGMKVEAKQNASAYSLAAAIDSTGLARAFRKFSYRGASNGTVNGLRLSPDRYLEKANTGRRESEVEMTYRDGVPVVVTYSSPDDATRIPADPAQQGGTLDPLSGIYALLRDVARADACKLDVYMFDGRRRSRIAMQEAGQADGLPVCSGVYERLDGFTAEEVSRHHKFDFTLGYRAGEGDILQVRIVSFASFYGTATLERR